MCAKPALERRSARAGRSRFCASRPVAPAKPPAQTLEIVSKTGVHALQVELAVDDARARTRPDVPQRVARRPGHAVRFPASTEPVALWMQNTYISLDMLFIRGDGRIVRIAENAEPGPSASFRPALRCARCWK